MKNIGKPPTAGTYLHRFLYEEGHGGCVPDLEPMRRSRPLPFAPTMAEVERLLETANRTAANASVGLYRQAGYARRAALLETLYASGKRISEAVSLPASVMNRQDRALIVKGKGARERMILLNAASLAALERWRHI